MWVLNTAKVTLLSHLEKMNEVRHLLQQVNYLLKARTFMDAHNAFSLKKFAKKDYSVYYTAGKIMYFSA